MAKSKTKTFVWCVFSEQYAEYEDGVARNDFYDNQEVGKYTKKYEKVNNGDKVRYGSRIYTVYATKNLTEGGVTTQFVQFTGKPSYSGAPRGTGKWIPRKDVEKL